MLLLWKCRLWFLFISLPWVIFGQDRYTEAILDIQKSQQKIWEQLVELARTEDSSDSEKSVELVSSHGNRLYVSQVFARTLLSLDSFGRLKRTDERFRGHHPVVRLGDLFFKSDVCLPPLDPMMETAVFFFRTLLFKDGVVPSDFIFVKNLQVQRLACSPWNEKEIQQVLLGQEEAFCLEGGIPKSSLVAEKQNHLLQVSQAVEGERASSFLAAVDEGTKSLDDLEVADFQKHIISDILLIPGDHKSENFIITHRYPKRRLVNIDNDGVFYHTSVAKNSLGLFSDKQPFGGCKDILFLLKPLMNLPIDLAVRFEFDELDVDGILRVYLALLQEQNERVTAIFIGDPAFAKRYESNYMPLRFPERAVSRLKKEMYCIKSFLKKNPVCSSEDLLFAMRPHLAEYYAWMLQQHKAYMKTIGKLYANERPFSAGRVPVNRIGAKPLKGRWIFQELRRYKESRNTVLSESMKELDLPLDMISEENSLLPDSSGLKEVLLKNSDDDLWRDWVARDFLHALYERRLPESMKREYPYNYLQERVKWLQNNSKDCFQKVSCELMEFASTQKVYEDFIFYFFEEKYNELNPPDGVLKCLQSIPQGE